MKATTYLLPLLLLPLTGATAQAVPSPRAFTATVWVDSAVFRLVAPPGAYLVAGGNAASPTDWRRFEWLIGWVRPNHEPARDFDTGVTFWLPERTAVGAADALDPHVIAIHPLGSIDGVYVEPKPPSLSAGWLHDTLWIRLDRSSALNQLLAWQPDSLTVGPTAFGRWLSRGSARVIYHHR